jgi:hypothetical protein
MAVVSLLFRRIPASVRFARGHPAGSIFRIGMAVLSRYVARRPPVDDERENRMRKDRKSKAAPHKQILTVEGSRIATLSSQLALDSFASFASVETVTIIHVRGCLTKWIGVETAERCDLKKLMSARNDGGF